MDTSLLIVALTNRGVAATSEVAIARSTYGTRAAIVARRTRQARPDEQSATLVLCSAALEFVSLADGGVSAAGDIAVVYRALRTGSAV